MKAMDLLIGFGSVKDSYVLGAEEFRQGKHKSQIKRLSTRRVWLIAAVVALMLLLVGCAVAVYARIHMTLVQHQVATVPMTQEDEADQNPLTDCYPHLLPPGYTMLGGEPIDRASRNIRYRSDTGKMISFSISTQKALAGTLAPPNETTTVRVSQWDATMQISGRGAQSLAWYHETDGYYASLFTEDMTVDLIAMAESVAFGKPLPLSFLCKQGTPWEVWYPQQLPEGYHIRQVSPGGSGTKIIDYTGDDGAITYCVSFVEDLSDISDPPHDSFVWTEETVAGQPGRMMTTSSGLRLLFWRNAQEGFNAMLSVDDGNVDIFAMAESVAPGAPLEVSPVYLGPDYSIELEQEPDTYVGWEPVYPQAVPEGYTITFVTNPAYGEQTIRYEKNTGEVMSYTIYFRLGKWGRQFDGMGQPQQVDINGNPGYLAGNSLIWTDEAKGFAFALAAGDDVDLVAVAKSVGIGPELEPTNAHKTEEALLELGDYQITALPAGMVEDGLMGYPLADGGGWYSYVRRWYFNKKTNQELFFTYESYVSDAASVEEVIQMNFGESCTQFRTILGCTGAAMQEGDNAQVVWVQGDEAKGVIFMLISPDYSVEELLSIAQSVQKQ